MKDLYVSLTLINQRGSKRTFANRSYVFRHEQVWSGAFQVFADHHWQGLCIRPAHAGGDEG